MTEYIYGLIDPTNQAISYIGRSSDPTERWSSHIDDEVDTAKTRWLRKLKASGIHPVVVVLEKVDQDRNAGEVERMWVDMGLRLGWPLTNTLLVNGTKYKRREIDRFSESIADWMLTNHLDKVAKAVARVLTENTILSPIISTDAREYEEQAVVEQISSAFRDAEKIEALYLSGASQAEMIRCLFERKDINTGGHYRRRLLGALSVLDTKHSPES